MRARSRRARRRHSQSKEESRWLLSAYCFLIGFDEVFYLDGFMLNPGLSAIWSEEDKRRKELEIKVPLQAADEPGKLDVSSSFILTNAFSYSQSGLM